MALTLAALRRKVPTTDEVLIAANVDQRENLIAARKRLDMALLGDEPERVESARKNLEDAKEQIRKTGVAFTLVSVGRIRWDELLIEHKPTEEQKAADADKPENERDTMNPVTFWPALLAESVPDSKLTADQWRDEVLQNPAWNAAEQKDLRDRAVGVNQDSLVIDLGN